MSASSCGGHAASRPNCRALSGSRASTSGRSLVSASACRLPHVHQHSPQPALLQTQGVAQAGQLLVQKARCHKQTPVRQAKCQAQNNERPVMEQIESELITTTDNSNGRSNGSRAPMSNAATNMADRPQNSSLHEDESSQGNGSSEQKRAAPQNGASYDNESQHSPRKPVSDAETSQDEDNSDAGAQTNNSSSRNRKDKAAARVPGGVTEADNESTPKPASFWLPHAEPEDFIDKPATGGVDMYLKQLDTARSVMMNGPRTASSFVKRRVQQLMLSNTAVKITSLLFVALPAVLVGGEAYSYITGQPASNGFIKIYSVLLMIPGVNLLSESNLVAGILLNVMFLLGTFTFAVVLGVVSDDISSEVKAIRSGNYPVMDKDHILVLNWNRQTIPLLRQLALATKQKAGQAQKYSISHKHKLQQSKGMFLADKAVVIMAERSKTEMDAEVQAALKGYKVRWQTREGAPYSASDLQKVSASQASTVILMRPDNSRVVYKDDDSPAVRRKRLHQIIAQREVAALLGINAGNSRHKAKERRQQNIIVQAPEDGTDVVTAAKRVLTEPGLNALGLKDRRDITRLVAQSALQPGVASVHASILQKTSDSVSFHLRDMPALHGISYGDIRRRFSTAIVTGTYGADKMPHLNPKDSNEYQPGDKLIFLANKDDFSPSRDGAATEYDRFLKEGYSSIRDGVPNNAEPPPKSVVIVGWCGDIQDLVDSLELFASGKTTVTVLCDCCPDNFPEEDPDAPVEFRYMCGDTDHSGALIEAGVTEADAIIIGGQDDLSDNEADASMLSSIIMVQDLLIESQRPRSRPVHVVGVVRCQQTVKVANYMVRDLAQGTMTAELLQPDELVSGLMAQVTSEPSLAPLLSELIHSTEGQEVRLREPADYRLHDLKKTTWAEVAEYARSKSETAIGYVSMQGELFLAPEAGHKHVYRNTDHIVVIAKE